MAQEVSEPIKLQLLSWGYEAERMSEEQTKTMSFTLMWILMRVDLKKLNIFTHTMTIENYFVLNFLKKNNDKTSGLETMKQKPNVMRKIKDS